MSPRLAKRLICNAAIALLLAGCAESRVVTRAAPGPLLVDNGDGTVTDTSTGLLWQKSDTEGMVLTWSQAKDYCESLTLAGGRGWRLPSPKELSSLSGPAVDERGASPLKWTGRFYWTTTLQENGLPLVGLFMEDGFAVVGWKKDNPYVAGVGPGTEPVKVRAVTGAPQ